MQHFNVRHRIQRHRQIQVVVRRLRIVHTKSIEQHQRLLKGCSANRQVRWIAARSALIDLHGGVGTQIVFDRVVGQRDAACVSITTTERADSPSEMGSGAPRTVTVVRTVSSLVFCGGVTSALAEGASGRGELCWAKPQRVTPHRRKAASQRAAVKRVSPSGEHVERKVQKRRSSRNLCTIIQQFTSQHNDTFVFP